MLSLFTIGHSNHEPDIFLRLLRSSMIEVVIDIRSNPNSSWVSHANKQNLKRLLQSINVRYLFMGDVLGGHPSDSECFIPQTGKVDYQLMQRKESFQQGITRVINGCNKYTICLMCAEENPIHCHRSLLVGSALTKKGVNILHIRGDGRIQTDEELLKARAGVATNQQRFL